MPRYQRPGSSTTKNNRLPDQKDQLHPTTKKPNQQPFPLSAVMDKHEKMTDTTEKFFVGGEIEEAPAPEDEVMGAQMEGQAERLLQEEEEVEEERTDEVTAVVEGDRGEQSTARGIIPISSSFPRFSNERTPLLRPSPSFVG